MLEGSVLAALGVLTICTGALIRWRVLKRTGRVGSSLSSSDIRAIEEHGSLAIDDDPLDLEGAREAEERFWQETWDDEI